MCCEKVAIHVFFMASNANKLKNAKKKKQQQQNLL